MGFRNRSSCCFVNYLFYLSIFIFRVVVYTELFKNLGKSLLPQMWNALDIGKDPIFQQDGVAWHTFKKLSKYVF